MPRALLLACALGLPTHAGDDLLALDAAAGPGLSAAWQVRAVRGQEAPRVVIDSADGARFVRISGRRRAGWIMRDLRESTPNPASGLRWVVRVPRAPSGADLSRADRDDAAIRLVVVFDHGRWRGAPRTVIYTARPAGAPPSNRSRAGAAQFHRVDVDVPVGTSDWTAVQVDPLADYRARWGASPPRVLAVGFLQDTDQTGEDAIADVAALEWLPPARRPGVNDPPSRSAP